MTDVNRGCQNKETMQNSCLMLRWPEQINTRNSRRSLVSSKLQETSIFCWRKINNNTLNIVKRFSFQKLMLKILVCLCRLLRKHVLPVLLLNCCCCYSNTVKTWIWKVICQKLSCKNRRCGLIYICGNSVSVDLVNLSVIERICYWIISKYKLSMSH